MIGIVYSKQDPAGTNMAQHLIDSFDFEEVGKDAQAQYGNDCSKIFGIDALPIEANDADSLGCELLFFLSQHRSKAGISALTTHSLGNWTKEAAVGGKPKQLSYAAPLAMLTALTRLNSIDVDVEKTYEATHHGPLLKTPSLFVELGGNDKMINNKGYAANVAEAAYDSIKKMASGDVEYSMVVIGVGSTHYPDKFTKLALERGYAFSHIMPRYAIMNEDGTSNLDVLEQALERTTNAPERAVVEWKSMNSIAREQTIKKLGEIGLDYEKV